jgi:acetyltransferase-like isoleucine patch superfamily enzyme
MFLNKKYFILKIINKLKYHSFRPLRYAKSVGVKVGNNTKIMTKQFGTEPYLITIGDNCEITAGVNFITHDGGVWVIRNLYEEYKNIDILKPIIIGNNVYIGNDVTILPGVNICNDVLIGAGAVVTKTIRASGVYAGVPCKFICTLAEYIIKNKKYFSDTKQLNYFEKKLFFKQEKV